MSRRAGRAGGAWRLVVALAIVVVPALVWWVFLRPVPTEVTVYFVRSTDGEGTLEPVTRTVRARSVDSRLRGAYQALLDGPTPAERARGLVSEIPAGTTLRGLLVAGPLLVVDLSAEVERGGGSASMLGRVWQIVFTGTQFREPSRVRILVEGQQRKALGGEGVVIEEPIARPPTVPTF